MLPPIPSTLWIARVLVPHGDLWRPEKPIRALETLPAVGDAFALDDGTPSRVEGVRSPAMSGVHVDVYVSRESGVGSRESGVDSR